MVCGETRILEPLVNIAVAGAFLLRMCLDGTIVEYEVSLSDRRWRQK